MGVTNFYFGKFSPSSVWLPCNIKQLLIIFYVKLVDVSQRKGQIGNPKEFENGRLLLLIGGGHYTGAHATKSSGEIDIYAKLYLVQNSLIWVAFHSKVSTFNCRYNTHTHTYIYLLMLYF